MLALRGAVWTGYGDETLENHVVLVDGSGVITQIAPYTADVVPETARVVGSPGSWIGPGVYDRHVHLAHLQPRQLLAGGVVAVRDLGAPEGRPDADDAESSGFPVRSVGQMLTTMDLGLQPREQPAEPLAVDSAEQAAAHTEEQYERGAQAIKIGLHGTRSRRSTPPAVVAATVGAAHHRSLPVIARAQTVAMVARALEAGVDELANTPAEILPRSLVGELKDAGVSVCSTLQMLFATGLGHDAARNASALVAAGVPLHYGTDLGNVAARPGVDPRELDRLAGAGLGRYGALRAASFGPLEVGRPARLVLLHDDPVREPAAWWAPVLTVSGTQMAPGAGGPDLGAGQ